MVRGHDSLGGPVVLGLNGSHDAALALLAAFEQASTRSAELLVAHAHPVRQPMGADARATALYELAQAVEPWRDRYPGVRVGDLLTSLRSGR